MTRRKRKWALLGLLICACGHPHYENSGAQSSALSGGHDTIDLTKALVCLEPAPISRMPSWPPCKPAPATPTVVLGKLGVAPFEYESYAGCPGYLVETNQASIATFLTCAATSRIGNGSIIATAGVALTELSALENAGCQNLRPGATIDCRINACGQVDFRPCVQPCIDGLVSCKSGLAAKDTAASLSCTRQFTDCSQACAVNP